MKRRKKNKVYEVAKRCRCTDLDRKTCAHHWFLRVQVHKTRQRVDLTELFPHDSVEVAAVKAKELARKGIIAGGRMTGPSADARLTCQDVADKFMTEKPGKHHYVRGMLATVVPGPFGTTLTIGSKPIADVTTRDIKAAVSAWQGRKKAKAGVRGGAVADRHFKTATRVFFKWAIKENYTTVTPFKTMQGENLIDRPPAVDARSRRLRDDEGNRIIAATVESVIRAEYAPRRDAVAGDLMRTARVSRSENCAVADAAFIKDFFTAMLETGCRPGELRTLQWSEVDHDEVVVLSGKAKTRRQRRIPIRPRLREILDRRIIGPDGQRLSQSAYAFGDDTGEMTSKAKLNEAWVVVCRRAQVVGLHLHDLRAEFASRAMEKGMTIAEVRDSLGHSNATMTDTYLRSRGSLKSAFDKLG